MRPCSRIIIIIIAISAVAGLTCSSPAPVMAEPGISQDATAQSQRPRTRLRVTPLPGPLRRECVPVFRERWIPQWGGWVLNAGQRCWWTRAPL
jgi:hypothetical protein